MALGLTSRTHVGFVTRTGYYGTVLAYEDLDDLRPDGTVFVDFAGNGELVGRVHRHLGDALRYSCRVGVTHWERMASPEALPGPEPVFFFAPDQARRRMRDWGGDGFQSRVGEAMRRFLGSTTGWLRVVEGRGHDAVEAVYRATLEGRANPAEGHVLSL